MALPSVTRAFLIHFGISLLIFLVLTAVMMKIWFPGDLFTMDGGWEGLKIIAPIDLILGPALTLCFYRPWKKNVRFDMAAIAMVQVVALSYGVYAAYHQRTAAIVFAGDGRFETLSLNEYKSAREEIIEMGLEPKSLKEFGDRMPVIIHARNFEGDEYGQYLEDLMNGVAGPELRERSDRYKPIRQARAEIAKYRVGAQTDGTTIELTASSADTNDQNPAEIYKLTARYIDGTIEFDPGSFELIRIAQESENQ